MLKKAAYEEILDENQTTTEPFIEMNPLKCEDWCPVPSFRKAYYKCRLYDCNYE